MAQITEKTSDKKQSELKKWREAAAALMRPSAAAARSMTTVENTAKGAASAMQAAAAAAAKTATATAKAAKAAARYTASFDEIEKLPAAPQAEEAGTDAFSIRREVGGLPEAVYQMRYLPLSASVAKRYRQLS